MGDPERLLGRSSADPEARELLESLRGLAPDAHLAQSSWTALAAKLGALPALVPGAASAPLAPGGIGASASKALTLKLVAAVVTSGAVAGMAYRLSSTEQPQPAASASAVSITAPPSSALLPVAPAATAPSAAPAARPSAAERAPLAESAAPRSSPLEAEASLLAEARRKLRSGDAAGALKSLNQLQSSFPRGQLTQERDVLAVEVLAASGDTALAKRKALAFIAAHPQSPHNARLRRFAEAP